MIKITFPDGAEKEFPEGIPGSELAAQVSRSLGKNAVAIDVDDQLKGLNTLLIRDSRVRILTFEDEQGREVYRHTSSHVMAQAVLKLFPGTKLAIGPSIADGFYYDLDSKHRFTVDDFPALEEEIKKIIAEDQKIKREDWSRAKALEYYKQEQNPYKQELLEALTDETVSIYKQGDFLDLCKGPHLTSTGKVGVIRLLKVAGAYWRGDEKNAMLQRIYATAFPDQKSLQVYLDRIEEAEKRDHRKIGRDLNLFSIQEEAGPGLIFWHAEGAAIRSSIEDFWREEHARRGYSPVYGPHIANAKLWQTSGHLENYAENMYSPIDVDGTDFILKPMNCPFHILMYKHGLKSYRDLPIRWAELGTVYRYEKSGVLHGMLRVRGFTQDDAHIFCREDQLEDELKEVIDLAFYMLRIFGFSDVKVFLSTRPEKFVGEPAVWDKATEALRTALSENKVDFSVDEGGGAFYGPKIDMKLIDALGREWQGPTIQVDFNLPERFDMTYIGSDGEAHRPVMIHRAVLGSMERFVGTLIEHYAGKFPLWLAPVQVAVLAIGGGHKKYVEGITKKLVQNLIRARSDVSDNKLGHKIREAQMSQIPYMLVAGDREVEAGTVNVRKRDGTNLGAMKVDDCLRKLQDEIKNRI